MNYKSNLVLISIILNVLFLPSAKVLLYNNENKAYLFRDLFDSGSECSFVSGNDIRTLELKRKNDRIVLNGIVGVSAGQTRGSVTLTVGSKLFNESLKVQAYILPKTTSQLPAKLLDTKNIVYLRNITFADEDFMKPKECDIILGSDSFFTVLRYRIVSTESEPIALNSMFVWMIAGKLELKCKYSSSIKSNFLSVENELSVDILLQTFWQAEEIDVKKPHLFEKEEFCEHQFCWT